MTVLLNDTIYKSHKELIEKVVKDMDGSSEKAEELVKKLLDKTDLKAKKDPNKPKKPPTGYQLFCKEYNNNPSENKPTTLIELSKLQSKMWRDLSKDDKDKYIEHAAAKKDLYKKAMEIYNQRSAPVIKKVVV